MDTVAALTAATLQPAAHAAAHAEPSIRQAGLLDKHPATHLVVPERDTLRVVRSAGPPLVLPCQRLPLAGTCRRRCCAICAAVGGTLDGLAGGEGRRRRRQWQVCGGGGPVLPFGCRLRATIVACMYIKRCKQQEGHEGPPARHTSQGPRAPGARRLVVIAPWRPATTGKVWAAGAGPNGGAAGARWVLCGTLEACSRLQPALDAAGWRGNRTAGTAPSPTDRMLWCATQPNGVPRHMGAPQPHGATTSVPLVGCLRM